MKDNICGKSGSVIIAEQKISGGLKPLVRPKFVTIMEHIRNYLENSSLELCAPPSENWITVKYKPRKAVIALVNESDGSLKFDIDTYEDNDINDSLNLLDFIPNDNKPNKRHVGYILENTSDDILEYFINKMIEGMSKFD